ncbi:squalene synthase HpnC [Xylophilus sp. GW821-FHT01B05]
MSTPSFPTADSTAPAPDHYENFPVASWLCPPALRPPIAALYAFARTADDLADEGDAPAEARLADLAAYRADLQAVAAGQAPSPRWTAVFSPLAVAIAHWKLPVPLLEDLLDAFAQDVRKTHEGSGYADRAELLDYCRRSANPVGRLLLHLYGVTGAAALAESDAICSALQLVNFWQDLSVDIPRGRFYLTEADRHAHGVPQDDVLARRQTPAATALVADCCAWARTSMRAGAPLVHRIPGRAGWELRLVVQGGLRILDRIAALDHATLLQRPTVGARDLPVMLWRAAWM